MTSGSPSLRPPSAVFLRSTPRSVQGLHHPAVRRSLLLASVLACLCAPAYVGLTHARDVRRAAAERAVGESLLDTPLARAPGLSDLPLGEARAHLALARESARGGQSSREVRALELACDALEAIARGEFATAAHAADGALRLQPEQPHALLAAAAAHAGRGDRPAAERTLEQLARARGASASLRARGNLLRAEWMLDAGRAHEALDALEGLDREHPRIGAVLNLLGLARASVGDHEGALRAFESAVGSHARREVPLINLARSYRDRGELDRARRTLEQALEADRNSPEAWVAYAVVLADLRDPQARATLTRAADLAPQDATPLAALGALELGLGQLEPAAETFRRALARDPDHAVARTNLGIVLARLGRNDHALRAFEQTTERAPHVGQAWNGLGAMRLAAGDHPGAVGALRQAMTLLPEDPNPAINLGRALEALRQWDAAGRAYREALRRQPQHPAAIERLLAITPPADRDRERRRLGLLPEPNAPRARIARTLAAR